MSTLKDKTLFITGASRGIGRAIALRAAKDGANIVVAAKTATPHPKLPGTIFDAAEEIESLGGKALPFQVDIRDDEAVDKAVAAAAEKFGGIDILVNNASAINLTPTSGLPMKRYDLMHDVNTRGTYTCGRACLPYLKKADNPHILNMSPPLSMKEKWFAGHVGYTMAKYGMSMCVLGWAGEFKSAGIGVNALWPRTVIATAAVQNLLGGDSMIKRSRNTDVVADAAHWILTQPSKETTGNFFIDETVLRNAGTTDFNKYAIDSSHEPAIDFFVDED